MLKQFIEIKELGELSGDPLLVRTVKIMEEVGELAEAVNHHEGYLPHKTMKEEAIGEVADVIINALAILHKLYPGSSIEFYPGFNNEYLYKQLLDTMDRKNTKWRKVMTNG